MTDFEKFEQLLKEIKCSYTVYDCYPSDKKRIEINGESMLSYDSVSIEFDVEQNFVGFMI